MAVFDRLSRYVKPRVEPYEVTDIRGRKVLALPMREPIAEVSVGQRVRREGERLDHIASAFLADPHAYWRLAEANGAILPDALTEVERLNVPSPIR
jgi:hypothetical protein